MLSMAIQSSVSSAFFCSSFPSYKPSLTPKTHLTSPSIFCQRTIPISRNRRAIALAAPEALTAETTNDTEGPQETPSTQETEEAKVLVRQIEKPRLLLKFIWMEKNIGLALDQQIPGHGTVPLSPYFFWPRKDAWEELKAALESKPWISQKKMIILLNQATDIINLWQQSGGNLNA